MKPHKKELLAFTALLIALGVFSHFAGQVLTPKRLDYGANLRSFQAEEKNTIDIVFMGSSVAYCDIIPNITDEQTGLNSYVLAGPEQTFAITYAYMEELFKTQSPEMIFLEISAVIFDDYYENSNKINIMYMPSSLNKVKLAFSQAEFSDLPAIFFPLYSYHSRWSSLSSRDFILGFSGYKKDSQKGYTYLEEIRPMDKITEYGDLEIALKNADWLIKLNALAEENDAQAVFFLAPRTNRISGEIVDFLQEKLNSEGLNPLIDMNIFFDEWGFDMSKDFYDSMHFNYNGAEKFSKHLADLINEGYFESSKK